MNDLNIKIDNINNVLSMTFKFGVALGGIVLLLYCWRIGYFPQDVSIGDGFLFILLALAFSGLYLFFVITLTSVGYILMYIWDGIKYASYKMRKFLHNTLPHDDSASTITLHPLRCELIVLSLFGFFFIMLFSRSDIKTAAGLVLCAWCCIMMCRYHQNGHKDILTIELKENPTEDDIRQLKKLRNMQTSYVVALLLLPLMIGGIVGQFLDGVMRFVNIRSDAVIVHIHKPYDQYAAEHGLKGQESAFGKEYAKFDNASVLFNGFGKNAVIEIKREDRLVSLVIPSESLFIIQKHQVEQDR